MNKQVADFYCVPNIGEYEDIHLLTLSETCAQLEEQVFEIAKTLPDKQRYTIEEYIHSRDDLDIETFKAALRWGKNHCK